MRKLMLAVAALAVAAPAVPAQTYLGRNRVAWMKDLRAADPATRRTAAFALGKMGSDGVPAVRALKEALDDRAAAVRDAAAFALGEVAASDADAVWREAGPALLDKLGDSDRLVRRSAACALGRCRAPASTAQPALARALRDAEPVVRRNAAWALGKIGKATKGRAAVDSLIDALGRDREDVLVLRDVAGALGEIGRPAAEPAAKALAELYRVQTDPALKRTALSTLVNLVGPTLASAPQGQNRTLVTVLHEALLKGDPESKGLAAGALANLGEHAQPALKDLAALLDDPKAPDATRRNAVLALTRAPNSLLRLPPEELQVLIGKLARALDPDRQPVEVRILAAEALARVNFPAIEPAKAPLVKAVKSDPDERVRHRAVWCFLGADLKKHLDARAALEAALKEPNKALRYDAARALANSLRGDVPGKAIDALEEMLRDPAIKIYRQTDANVRGGSESSGGQSTVKEAIEGDARYMAADALALVGRPAAKPVIRDTLRDLAKSEDEHVRKSATAALRKIFGE